VTLIVGAGAASSALAAGDVGVARQHVSLTLGFSSAVFSRGPHSAPTRELEMRSRFVVTKVSSEVYRIDVRVPGARSVEFASDCTGWQPRAMTLDRGTWTLTLPVQRGVHRVNVRVNGGRWIPPSGLPTTDDDFAGQVGLFIVN
jgi:hypothetical protein